MGNDWIVAVLADLKDFARTNDLPLLADRLDEALLMAQLETVSNQVLKPDLTGVDGVAVRQFSGRLGAGNRPL